MTRSITSSPSGYPFRLPTADEALAMIFGTARDHEAQLERAVLAAVQDAAIGRVHGRLAMSGWPCPLAVDGHAYHRRARRRTRSRGRR